MRILIATRSTAYSDTAVRQGNFVHQLTGGAITLLTVINDSKKRAGAETALLEVMKLLDTAETQIQSRIRVGRPVEEIATEAVEGNCDLVVIGEPAPGRFIRRSRAPIAEELIDHLACPVLITRGEPRPVRKVLVCESGHDPSLIDDLTTQMASILKQAEEVTVLHVMSQIAAGPGVAGWQLRAEAEELIDEQTPEGIFLEEGVLQVEELDIHPEPKVRHGLVVREILKEAKSGDYDLVIIGAHPGKGWEHLLLGDLAREIIGQIDRPLLVIKR